MDENLTKLKQRLYEIDSLAQMAERGPEFQVWLAATGKLVKGLFGEEAFSLFDNQQTRTFSYIDGSFNRRQFLRELENRKKIIDSLLSGIEEYVPTMQTDKAERDLLKEIWRKQEALQENLLPTNEAQSLQQRLLAHLETIFPSDSIPGLKFKKIRIEKRLETWWSDQHGYPTDNAWQKIEPFLSLLERHEAERTIKHRFETEGLFVESRSQNGDQHILIGERNGDADKAHVIIDHKTGEIRVEKGRQEPLEIIDKVEAILTLKGGKKIRTTREAIEEISTENSLAATPAKKPIIDFTNGFSHMSNSQGRKIQFQLMNSGDATAYDIEISITSDGEGSLEQERSPFQVPSLLPAATSSFLEIKYSHLSIAKTKLSNPRIRFAYKDAEGNRFESSRALLQVLRADNEFNIDRGEFLGVKYLKT